MLIEHYMGLHGNGTHFALVLPAEDHDKSTERCEKITEWGGAFSFDTKITNIHFQFIKTSFEWYVDIFIRLMCV